MSQQNGSTYTVGQYLVDRLREIGVGHLFAIPGDYCADWVQDYVQPASSGIERIGPTNELCAGYAADGYARMTGGVGAVCVTYSVGAFSALNAIAGSFTERVPVVLINGAPGIAKRLQHENGGLQWHHMMNGQDTNLRVFREVTVAAERISDPGQAPAQIDAALRACLTERRPVYLETLEDVYDKPCARPEDTLSADPLTSDDAFRAAARANIVHRLKTAERPLLWAGAEIARYGLEDAFLAAVEALGIPFVTSLSGKGVVSEGHPLFYGVFDGPASEDAVTALVDAADYVVGLGVWLTDGNLHGDLLHWEQMALASRGVVRAGVHLYAQVRLGDVLEDLERAAGDLGPYDEPDRPAAPERPSHDPADALTYQGVYDVMAGRLDGGTVVMGGTGFNYFGSLEMTVGRGGYVTQANYADIGYVTPAAIGVGLGQQACGDDRRVVVFAGDGGFQMTATGLSTLAHLELDPIILLLDNGVYGIEQWLADPSVFGDDQPFFPLCVRSRWDYAGLCEALGGRGHRAETYAELEAALDAADGTRDGPTLIQCVVPSKSLPDNAEYKVDDGDDSRVVPAAANPAA